MITSVEFTKMGIIFDITHWLTREDNELHSTAMTFFGLTWIEIVFILLEFLMLRFYQLFNGFLHSYGVIFFMMPFVTY